MVTYMSIPCFKVTTTYGVDTFTFENDQFLSGSVTRIENGFDTATLRCNDYETVNWLNKMSAGSAVTVSVKDKSDASYTELFDGISNFLNLPMQKGWFLELECDGAGYGFGETSCGEQYGTESNNPTLDTILEILTDASHGIVTKWVNKVLGTATDSGYSYTTVIEDIAGSMRYHYFPFKPCNKTINDVCEVLQAIQGTNAGPHWIVTTDNKLLLSTIGSHHAAAVAEGWTTYLGGSQAAGTLEEGVDFKEFNFKEMGKEANYILYYGRLLKPFNEKWTENNNALWGKDAGVTLSDENVIFKVGSYSLKASFQGVALVFYFWYPSAQNAGWDIEKWGGEHNIPTLDFQIRRNQFIMTDQELRTTVAFVDSAANEFQYLFGTKLASQDTWYEFNLPIGPNYKAAQNAQDINWVDLGGADWGDIDYLCFKSTIPDVANAGIVYVDGLNLNGWVLRGARPSAAYSSTNPMKLKLITDDVGKDDSGIASDDSGTIARLAYAELLRCQTTPILGHFTTPMIKEALPGQLVHVKAKKKTDGTFAVDKDFRVTKLVQHFSVQGYFTEFFVTDDVKNANTRMGFDELNKVLADARPEFQDRQASSIKSREIDITQAILEKSY